MAMSCRPDLIIFDEPTTALDVTTQVEVLAAMRDIVEQFNTAAIYITHDLSTAAHFADRVGRWMAAVILQSLDGYRALLGRAGFRAVEGEDLSDAWRGIVRARLARFRARCADVLAALGEARYEDYHQLHAFFVGLVEAGKLGGGRFTATR